MVGILVELAVYALWVGAVAFVVTCYEKLELEQNEPPPEPPSRWANGYGVVVLPKKRSKPSLARFLGRRWGKLRRRLRR